MASELLHSRAVLGNRELKAGRPGDPYSVLECAPSFCLKIPMFLNELDSGDYQSVDGSPPASSLRAGGERPVRVAIRAPVAVFHPSARPDDAHRGSRTGQPGN